ncbi:MAG TPA: CheR family methyltransferase [Bacteroidales bacterium]|nr:CheR family methyltransferase [Bacteroidales bacterium]
MYLGTPIYTYQEIVELLHAYIPDISYYTKSFVERRFYYVCSKLYIPSLHAFQEKIQEDITFLDTFMQHFTVPVTEMFRDATVWKNLYTNILPQFKNAKQCAIWLPNCSSGEELYSLSIILKQLQMQNNTIVYASHRSLAGIESIKKGIYTEYNEQLNTLNFAKLQLNTTLDTFYTKSFHSLYMNASLLKNVSFMYSTSILQQIPAQVDIVLFRNSLLYFNVHMHQIILANITKHLRQQGYLLLGLQDNTMIEGLRDSYKIENKEERIYRKK